MAPDAPDICEKNQSNLGRMGLVVTLFVFLPLIAVLWCMVYKRSAIMIEPYIVVL